jgi:hypothetical protein
VDWPRVAKNGKGAVDYECALGACGAEGMRYGDEGRIGKKVASKGRSAENLRLVSCELAAVATGPATCFPRWISRGMERRHVKRRAADRSSNNRQGPPGGRRKRESKKSSRVRMGLGEAGAGDGEGGGGGGRVV